jgi:hypothetical protein
MCPSQQFSAAQSLNSVLDRFPIMQEWYNHDSNFLANLAVIMEKPLVRRAISIAVKFSYLI